MSKELDYKKSVYYEDDDFALTVELFSDVPFIHLNLKRASKQALETVLKKWAEVKALAYFDGYESIYTYTKDKRMFKWFSPTRIIGPMNYRGVEYEVAEWELK